MLVKLKNLTDIDSILSNCLENFEKYVLQNRCAHPFTSLSYDSLIDELILLLIYFFKTGNMYQALEKVARAHLDQLWTLLVFFLPSLQVFLVFHNSLPACQLD